MKNRKSCLVIGYFHMNYGDDLFLDILFNRYKNIDFYFYPPSILLNKYKKLFNNHNNVIFYDDEEEYKKIREDITDESVPINLFPSILKRAKIVDFYINIGGSIFIQNDHWEKDDRFEIKKCIGNKPSFIVGCNFGPGNDEYISYLKTWFKEFDDICFRDKYSYKLFKDLDNIRCSDDIVLSYMKKSRVIRKNSIGISLITVKKEYENDYLNFHEEIIRKFINDKYKINLYAFCYNDGDEYIIQKLLNRFTIQEIRNIKIIKHEESIKKFSNHFARNKYIIGSRFHAIILAILNNQKLIPILYSDKTSNYFKDLGYNFDDFFIDKLSKKHVSLHDFKNINYT